MEMSLEDVDFVLLLRLSQICDSMECVLRMVILSYCGDYSRQAPTWTGLLEMTVWFCVLLLRVGRCQQTPLETIYFTPFFSSRIVTFVLFVSTLFIVLEPRNLSDLTSKWLLLYVGLSERNNFPVSL